MGVLFVFSVNHVPGDDTVSYLEASEDLVLPKIHAMSCQRYKVLQQCGNRGGE